MANLPPQFNAQFIDDDGLPLAGGFLYTYVSGSTTPQTTYTDQAEGAENENPIELDAAGRCNLWLADGLEYDLLLLRADLTTVTTFEDVTGSAITSEVITSINGLTGDVTLTAEDVEFTTGTSTTWLPPVPDVASALDALISKLDETLGDIGITTVNAFKPASTARVSTTTMTADPDLAVTLSEGGVYEISAYLPFWSTTSGAGGLKVGTSYSGTSAASHVAQFGSVTNTLLTNGSNIVGTTVFAQSSTTPSADGALADWVKLTGTVIATTGGNLAITWAQYSSDANNLNLGAGAWLTCRTVNG